MTRSDAAQFRSRLSSRRFRKTYAEIRVLCGPARFKIAAALFTLPGRKAAVGHLARLLGASISKTSHRLRIMEKNGFVRGMGAGRQKVYTLRDHPVTRMLGL